MEEDKIDLAKQLMDQMGEKLMLPADHAVFRNSRAGGDPNYVKTIPADQIALDIGPETVDEYSAVIRACEDDHLERSDGRI